MASSSDTGVSETLDALAILSDDEIMSESEVYTSDTTSTNEDDFQPFALPDFGDDVPIADGPIGGDLPFPQVPAPLPFAAVPLEDLPHDELPDDDIDLFLEGPPEGDQDGVALMDADVPLADDPVVPLSGVPAVMPIADPVIPVEAPIEEAPFGLFGAHSFESVASASLHAQSVQLHSFDSDSDMAMSVAPHDDDPEPAVALELVDAPDPALEHDPIHADAPAIAPLADDIPIDDHPIVAPLLEDKHVVDAQVDAPHIADILAEPVVVAPLPDPVPLEPDHALFATHVDPRYAHTRNGWIDDDDEYSPFVVPVTPVPAPVSVPPEVPTHPVHTTGVHHTDLPVMFRQITPPSRPGEGSSTHPFGHVPTSVAVIPQFSSVVPPVPPFTVPPFTPASVPFLWTSPPIMPPSDPYHPFHMGYFVEDILMSFVVQQEALTRRVQELKRAQRPPCQCPPHPAISHPPRPLSPDSAARFWTQEQQITYLLRSHRAMEEDWLHMRRLFYSHFPPPPPPSA
ncbi:proline-rich protein 36-like [Helianthus annuus]|uniref:proline-rich protein 36-like n=1 Tax=Helianthus annuus TaxID=4232 RepID=UPI001652FD28|nr:proline-rich protein 36-like [Helianthus annuus]